MSVTEHLLTCIKYHVLSDVAKLGGGTNQPRHYNAEEQADMVLPRDQLYDRESKGKAPRIPHRGPKSTPAIFLFTVL